MTEHSGRRPVWSIVLAGGDGLRTQAFIRRCWASAHRNNMAPSRRRGRCSRHLLQGAPERLAVMELRDMLWSDWGRPRRIVQMLDRIGQRPAFADADLSALHA